VKWMTAETVLMMAAVVVVARVRLQSRAVVGA
jgi:hypothetical protein